MEAVYWVRLLLMRFYSKWLIGTLNAYSVFRTVYLMRWLGEDFSFSPCTLKSICQTISFTNSCTIYNFFPELRSLIFYIIVFNSVLSQAVLRFCQERPYWLSCISSSLGEFPNHFQRTYMDTINKFQSGKHIDLFMIRKHDNFRVRKTRSQNAFIYSSLSIFLTSRAVKGSCSWF